MISGLTASDWVLAASALAGPILAVGATRLVDAWRERSNRRQNIFITLVVTRHAGISAEHVEALNRIEIEFANEVEIVTALHSYMDLLAEPIELLPADRFQAASNKRRRAFATLVQSIGKKLKRRIDKMDFLEGGYYPQGWAEAENLQRENMKQLNRILKQQQSLNVQIVDGPPTKIFQAPPTPPAKFPPPPS